MPTTNTYVQAIAAWGNVGSPKHAEDLFIDFLRRSEGLKAPRLRPNTEIFAAAIRAWLKAAASEEAGQDEQIVRLGRGAEWLESMMSEENKGGPATTHDLFLTVLKSAKSCAFDAPAVLDVAYRTFCNLRDSRHHIDAKAYSWLLEVALLALAKPEHDEIRTTFVNRLVKGCCQDGLLSKCERLCLLACGST